MMLCGAVCHLNVGSVSFNSVHMQKTGGKTIFKRWKKLENQLFDQSSADDIRFLWLIFSIKAFNLGLFFW